VKSIELDGKLTSFSGACPAVTFVIDGQTVYASSSTTYSKIKCDDLKIGRDVTVQGMLMSDGRVRADVISVGK